MTSLVFEKGKKLRTNQKKLYRKKEGERESGFYIYCLCDPLKAFLDTFTLSFSLSLFHTYTHTLSLSLSLSLSFSSYYYYEMAIIENVCARS